MSKWFNIFLFTGIFLGIFIEVVNHVMGNSYGLGAIIYFLTLILYFQIFQKGESKKKKK